MTLIEIENDTAIFVVRIWREKRELVGANAFCRGVIEHLPNKHRRYFHTFKELTEFVQSRLDCPDMIDPFDPIQPSDSG